MESAPEDECERLPGRIPYGKGAYGKTSAAYFAKYSVFSQ